MKAAAHPFSQRKPIDSPPPDSVPAATRQRSGTGPSAVVLRSGKDPRRQHAAIGKLVKMCQASPVVARASHGITAEIRRDRNNGHD